jgi:hypothetical protein
MTSDGETCLLKNAQVWFIRFEVLTAALLNVVFYWDIAPFGLNINRRFGGT